MSEMILEINSLNDISLNVRKGELVSLIGINGSGKTALMNAIAGLVPPASGRIIFDGKDIAGLPPDKIVERGISLVPQGGRCFSRMSVYDNPIVGSFGKNARRSVRSSLERVYELFPVLYEKRKLPAGSLSGGQRQMAAIGRALMSRPKLILFDELSLGLAPVVIKDIYAAVKRISSEEGTSMIMVEQDTKRAMQMTDRTYIMLKGHTVLEGRSDELSDEAVKKAYFGS